MEQFQKIGKVVGGLKALMVFRDNIKINQRQCILLLDIFTSAFDLIAEEMRDNLKFKERNLKWKILEQPLKELLRVLEEGEVYIKQCLDSKLWWAKALIFNNNTDCVEFHIHNLLCCVSTIVEAIENATELSGCDHDEMQTRKRACSNKYSKEWTNPRIFQWKYGRQYLVTPNFCSRLDIAWKEDRWLLLNTIHEKRSSCNDQVKQLGDLLCHNLNGVETLKKLFPSAVLIGSKDYHVRRRLGNGAQFKEISWLGESFAMRHLVGGDIEALIPEISTLLSLSHPNVIPFLCGFTNDEKKDCHLVMELMNRNLSTLIKEMCGPRKRTVPFSLPVTVDTMLQIARGMEYLHSKKIYHGDLNTSNILIRTRSTSTDGYLLAKVSGFGVSHMNNTAQKGSGNQDDQSLSFIFHAPEVLEEEERLKCSGNCKYTEKSDVYSFSMVCFELLTGKVPFDDGHLQGDKMSKNIRTGERPLFPHHSPKLLTNLTKRCWHAEPNQRPSFSSISRILRYIKRFLALNVDYTTEKEVVPMLHLDYWDIESRFLQRFPILQESDSESSSSSSSVSSQLSSLVSQVPFQMFVYNVLEKEKRSSSCCSTSYRETSESGSDRASISGDEFAMAEETVSSRQLERRATISVSSEARPKRSSTEAKKSPEYKVKLTGTGGIQRLARPPQMVSSSYRPHRVGSESRLASLVSPRNTSSRPRRLSSGHASDSDIP